MKIFDLHQDLSTYILSEIKQIDLDKDLERHCDIPKYRKAGVKALVGAVFPARILVGKDLSKYYSFKNSFEESFNHILTYYKIIRKHRDVFKLILSKRDLNRVFMDKTRIIGIILGLEGCYPVREIDDLDIYYNLGVRLIGLTWNYDNQYASGCMSKRDYGLTDLGFQLLDKAFELGLVVDLAHASYKTMIDVLTTFNKPVTVSHTGLKKFKDSPRNISDEIIDLVKRNNGVVGVFFVSNYIAGENTTVDHIVEQIMYIVDNFGVDVVALGSDYFGTDKLPRGLENIGLINNLVNRLFERGLDKESVEKIMYRNALRVFNENMK
ncbi:MAG: dipeptidase [Desulfurococcaceae archaeon]